MSTMNTPFVKQPRSTHRSTLIFLHGLGDNGSGWLGELSNLVPDSCKIICPNAPSIPVTINMGLKIPAWYDIKGLDLSCDQDESGIEKSSKYLCSLIKNEVKAGIPHERIIIGGFSQGSVISLYTALRSSCKLGGAMVLSGYLPVHDKFVKEKYMTQHGKDIPYYFYYGTDDIIILPTYTKKSIETLKEMGVNAREFCYADMPHSSCKEELIDLKSHIHEILSK